jgi:membrane protein implicated in regulation of membrane protease activity
MFRLGPFTQKHAKPTGAFDPVNYGKESVISEVIKQGKNWWIYYQGSYWKAHCAQQVVLNPGDEVYVIDRQNTLLLITPTMSSVPALH